MRFVNKIVLLFLAVFAAQTLFAEKISNDAYTVELSQKGTDFTVTKKGIHSWNFTPDFIVFRTEKDPMPRMRRIELPKTCRYNVVSWLSEVPEKKQTLKQLSVSESAGGDGIDFSILKGSVEGRTADVFCSAPSVKISASAAKVEGNKIIFEFPKNDNFDLSAELSLPNGDGEPILKFTLKPHLGAFYSVGFVGASAFKPEDADGVFQPFVWQEKRFPENSYMSAAYHCTLPATFVAYKGATLGLVVDSSEFPFKYEIPTLANSEFGVAVRDPDGLARPMIFAPMLGCEKSLMEDYTEYSFKMRIFVCEGGVTDAYALASERLYGFSDIRENGLGSLNETFDNMLDYGLSEFSRFKADEKGFAYDTDVKGSTRNDTSISVLNIANVRDREDIYRNISYPILEFMLSRQKPLFIMDESVKTQHPSKKMLGPCSQIAELETLYGLSHGSCGVLDKFAKEKYNKLKPAKHLDIQSGGYWPDAITFYENTGNKEYLKRAVEGADHYIAENITNPPNLFLHSAFFWNKYAPNFVDLFRLYEYTGERRFLDAARKGARLYTMFTWRAPEIPKGNILANPDGFAPLYAHAAKSAPEPIAIAPEQIPAWRVSEIGLTPEASGTMSGHRAIFMANFAPWMLRIAKATGDDYLLASARSAVVGRYMNFPGYHMNTARTTIFEKPDYPLRPHNKLSANSFHYNHVWPMMVMVLDWLVSDAETRSCGNIKMPSRFMDASAYMQSKIYGFADGDFYGRKDARLWMPSHLLTADNIQANYIAMRGKNDLYLAFCNQSKRALTTRIKLNADAVGISIPEMLKAKLWVDNQPAADIEVKNGEFEIPLSPSPNGITAVAIEGLKITPRFQDKIFNLSEKDAWKKDMLDIDSPFKARALMLNFGKDFQTAYVYMKDEDPAYSSVKLMWRDGNQTKTMTDNSYPFEFTVKISAGTDKFQFILETADSEGKTVRSPIYVLEKGNEKK